MAHELEIVNGTAFFADSRTDAWHQLGQQLERTMTAEEALEYAYLSRWNVRKTPAFTADEDGNMIAMPGRYATIRTNPVTGVNEYLGNVGERYVPVQNESLVEFMDALVDESGAHFETAGSLRGGSQVFVTMKVPAYMTFTSADGKVEDKTDLYIAVMNSHDGYGSLSVRVTPVRVVCANTQAAAIANTKSYWGTRHTINALKAVEAARQALSLNFAYADAFAEGMQKLIDRELDAMEMEKAVNAIFDVDGAETERAKNGRLDNAAQVMTGLNLKTVMGFENTAYGLYNAVTEWVDHRVEVKDGVFGAPAEGLILGGTSYTELKERAFAILSK
jgi:phage/plasmid-like protein (TIGR03299 family)